MRTTWGREPHLQILRRLPLANNQKGKAVYELVQTYVFKIAYYKCIAHRREGLMYTPKPEHKFTFGLWTVGNIGRDPFGGPTRELKTPAELVY